MSTPKVKAHASLLIIALCFLFACGPDPADPKSPEQVLLDRAVQALWGEVKPESIVALQTRSTLEETQDEFSATFDLETLLGRDGCYREVRRWKDFDLSEAIVQSHGKSWRTIDGTVVQMQEAEDKKAQGRQAWLFEVSKLTPLKDTTRFKLDHLGEHEGLNKGRVERLEVRDRERPDLKLIFDFTVGTWLVEQVTLEDAASGASLTLILKDYRAVDGVQFAHEIDSLQNGRPHARQRNISYVLNPDYDEQSFQAPVDLRRDAILRKRSVGGRFACTAFKPGEDDLEDAVAGLKNWIREHKWEICGPLVIMHKSAPAATSRPDDSETTQVAIAVDTSRHNPKEDIPPTAEYQLLMLKSQQALCMTHVGEGSYDTIKKRFVRLAADEKVNVGQDALEVYFSPEGTIRQLQFPIK